MTITEDLKFHVQTTQRAMFYARTAIGDEVPRKIRLLATAMGALRDQIKATHFISPSPQPNFVALTLADALCLSMRNIVVQADTGSHGYTSELRRRIGVIARGIDQLQDYIEAAEAFPIPERP